MYGTNWEEVIKITLCFSIGPVLSQGEAMSLSREKIGKDNIKLEIRDDIYGFIARLKSTFDFDVLCDDRDEFNVMFLFTDGIFRPVMYRKIVIR